MCIVLHAKYLIIFLDFCEPVIFWTDFKKFSNIHFHENPSGWSRVASCRHTDMTKLIIALCGFVNMPNSIEVLNPLNPELNPICYLLALLGAHHFLHVSRIRVKLFTFRRLMSCIYGAPILDVSRSHTTTQHSR